MAQGEKRPTPACTRPCRDAADRFATREAAWNSGHECPRRLVCRRRACSTVKVRFPAPAAAKRSGSLTVALVACRRNRLTRPDVHDMFCALRALEDRRAGASGPRECCVGVRSLTPWKEDNLLCAALTGSRRSSGRTRRGDTLATAWCHHPPPVFHLFRAVARAASACAGTLFRSGSCIFLYLQVRPAPKSLKSWGLGSGVVLFSGPFAACSRREQAARPRPPSCCKFAVVYSKRRS